jgi:DNA polymerase I-like protein with 3'-5' exonuclease and polymerase domains
MINDDKFLANSNPRVGRLLYEDLKFPPRKKRTESGELNWRTDKGTLDDLLINHSDKVGPFGKAVIARIIVTRKLAKVLEYLSTPLSLDGRFRSTSNLCGTETGRSSYSKSLDELFVKGELKRIGRSLQTISKHGFKIDDDVFEDFEDKSIAHDLRSMFVPSHGFIFLEADGSQAEARHVAVLSLDWDLLASFDLKPKVHAKTAAMLFDVDVNIITKDAPSIPVVGITYYDMGKRIRHGGSYKIGAGMISLMTHLPMNVTGKMLEKFHANNPLLREVFHHEIERIINEKTHPSYRRLRMPLGRARSFFGPQGEETIKEAIATIPQSSVSDHTKFSIPLILAKEPTTRFLAEMHDGLLTEVPKDDYMRYAQVVKKVMERPMSYRECTLSRDFDLVVPAELSVGENWMELKEIKVD